MEKTSNVIMNAVKNFSKTASKEEMKLFATYVIYNFALDSCENHWETIGLLDSIKTEIYNEFSKGVLVQAKTNLN